MIFSKILDAIKNLFGIKTRNSAASSPWTTEKFGTTVNRFTETVRHEVKKSVIRHDATLVVISTRYSQSQKKYTKEVKRLKLQEEVYVLGRSPNFEPKITVKSTSASREHLTIRKKKDENSQDQYCFRDENSKNGTYIKEPLWAILKFWQTGDNYQFVPTWIPYLPSKFKKVKPTVETKFRHQDVLIIGEPQATDDNGKKICSHIKFIYPPVWYVRLGIYILQALAFLIISYLLMVRLLIWSVSDVVVDPLPNSPAPLAIFASNKTTLMAGGFSTPHQEKKKLSEYPKLLIQTVLASEDQVFYSHQGINVFRIFATTIENILAGKIVGGASTIDQQVARTLFSYQVNSRNLFGKKISYNSEEGTKSTIDRKVREIGVALKLNATYRNKDTILLAYLNSIDLGYRNTGESIRGFVDASKFYFNKPVEELSANDPKDVAKIANLVALLRAPVRATSLCNTRIEPSQYEKAEQPEIVASIDTNLGDVRELKTLRNTIINLIRDRRYIPQTIAETAKKLINFNVFDNKEGFCQGQEAFLDYYKYSPVFMSERIRQEMRALSIIIPEEEAEKGKSIFDNYIVIASLDVDKQKNAKRILEESVDQLWINKRVPHGALITIDSHNGEILALVGEAKSPEQKYNYDYAATEEIPPASTFKLFFYTAALKGGMPTDRIFPCEDLQFEKETFPAAEYSGTCASGNQTIDVKNAVAFSDNLIPLKAVKQYSNMAEVVKVAEDMGIHTKLTPPIPQMAYGQYRSILREMTGAYAVIANEGKYNFPHAIREIRFNTNRDNCDSTAEKFQNCTLIYSYEEDVRRGKQVITTEVANKMTDLLKGVVETGLGKNADIRSVIGKDIAGKTGTSDGQQDGWFIGFIPKELVTGVWLGNFVQPALVTSPPPTKDFNSADAARVWSDYMYRCHHLQGCG